MTKFIKSLGLLVDVCICCSPLGYNKRRSWKKKGDLYLSGNFGNVCREMVSSMNKAAQSGGTQSEQLGLNTTAACDSFLLALSEHCTWKPVTISAMIWGHQGLLGSRLLALEIRTQKHHAVAYWGPFFCTSWLRMLSGRDAPRLVWQGLALFSWAAPGLSTALAALWLHQGYSTAGLAFFKELTSPRVSVHRWMPWSFVPMGLTAVPLHRLSMELLQLYRNAKESTVKLTVFKEAGLDLPDQARWKLRSLRKKFCPLTNDCQSVLWWGMDGPRYSQHLPEESNWLKWCRGWLVPGSHIHISSYRWQEALLGSRIN